MKYLIVVFLSLSARSYSQDVIYMVNGDSIVSKVTEISVENIKYKDYNNLEGPQYIISKEGVSKVVLNNVNEEIISKTKLTNLEETKAIIIEIIDKHAFSKDGDYKFIAKFNQNYLDLNYVDRDNPEKYLWNRLYDFSDECTFQNLSIRNKGISYINVDVHRIIRKKNDDFKKKNREKLVILIESHDKAKILREALIRYNEFFME